MVRMTILGAKRSKGVLDDGTAYDTTKLYIQTAMKKSEDQVGYASAEYNWGTSDNFKQLENLTFPCKADVVFEVVTNGKSSQVIVDGVEFVKQAPQTPKV